MKCILIILMSICLFATEDFELITKAYKNGLRPVPSDLESLLLELKLEYKNVSKEKVVLGKKLFFEKELSKNRDISCASCHNFKKGGADGIPTAIGHKGLKNPFHLNTPTVLNTAFSKKLFWNGETDTLKEQAKGPLQAPFEMAITPELAEKRIKEKTPYKELFKYAFGSDKISFEKIVEAIAVYEKTLVTKGRYDKFLTGNENALSSNEKEGLNLFITKGCVGCHNGIGLGGQEIRKFPLTYHHIWSLTTPQRIAQIKRNYFTVLSMLKNKNFNTNEQKIDYIKYSMGFEDFKLMDKGFFHRIVDNQRLKVMTSTACNSCHVNNQTEVKKSIITKIPFPFENKGDFLGSKSKEKYFRVPLLRNIVQTKPYFHNGSVNKLQDAINLMGVHQTRNQLTPKEIDDLVAFFKSVDGEIVEYLK
ncbi:cytochrome-c peroxidase [Candidatus Marinarcus aquaticus]|uniref:Cytochrome c domain-containing protein n=1 Tax=Candidatus Marinarcus aquaticus TaxID=2044504 RepID=A0A4Q0XPC5_9BACT|nr:cytochrome c peroxidase [Candidatus Marinarcus aquaticus]RXJ56470.1 hypothetical protein CRV04_08640 [Candidatus Marinarcus aquaticus]